MAMSDTGSSFAQWADELYNHHDPTDSPDIFPAITTTTTVASPPTSGGSGESPTKAAAAAAHHHLGVDGGARVGKAPARRRSRASRRAPVTLLNTDTANFRAMVQQFTGIPTPPAGAAFGGGGPVINFAGDYGGFPPASSGVMSSFDHLHRSHPAASAPVTIQEQLRRQQQYTGGMFGGYNGSSGAGGDLFASHGFSSAEDRMLMQSIQQAAHHMPPASAANGFFA